MMNRLVRVRAGLLALALAGLPWICSLSHGAVPPAFAHEDSDLAPDPAVRFGKLPNGMRYAILKNAEPKGRASLRLLVEAGSLHEQDNQQGLAHFLEHMAFNGSTHYPPGTLIEFFQRMGMSFGGDTNASTSFNRTLYLLELADTKEETTAEGVRVFSDYASGLLLQPAELDRERGIILSEKRARDSVDFRTFVAQFKFVLDGTLLPRRLPIGEAEIIEKAPRERFTEFYDRWYRPELTSVIAVGDFDPALIERQIVSAFTPFAARAPAAPPPDLGTLAPAPGVHVHHHPESEAADTSISIASVVQIGPEPDTAANRIKYLPRSLANAMLNRRLGILAKKENAPFIRARAMAAEQFDFLRDISLDLTTKADQWAEALAVGEQELRRALEHGFQPGELADVRSSFLNSLEQGVRTASTRRSPNLADGIAQSILNKNVFSHPSADLALFKPALEKITVEECAAALRETWNTGHRFVIVTGNAVIPDARAAIAGVYERSTSVPVSAPAREADVSWSYTDFGAPGRVIHRDHVADLDITRVAFANGVRLNLKKTPFQADRIAITARVGNGSMTEPPTQRGLSALAGGTFDAGGLGRHSTDEMMRIFSGKNVSISFRPAPDAFEFSGGSTPADLRLALELLAAKVSDPGYRPESLRLARKGLEQMYLGFAHTINGPLSTEVANLLAGGDPRFGMPPRDVMFSRTLEEVKAWLDPQLAAGAIEIALVGDLDVDAAIAAVGATLGALPKREEKPALDELRRVRFPAQPFDRNFTISSEIPKGAVALYWPTTDARDVRIARRLNLLAGVFTDRLRLKVREEMGGTYSPSARSFPSEAFPGYGYLNTNIDVDPAMAGKIADAAVAIAADLHANGVTDDELGRVRQPALTGVRESARTNSYWVNNVLARAQEKPEVLDWARSREADIASITAAELSALARTYLAPDRVSRAVILPEKKG